jgi:hypothetical protein
MRVRPVQAARIAILLAVTAATSGCHVLNPESCSEDPATIVPLDAEMLSTTDLPWPDSVTTAIVIRPDGRYAVFGGRPYASEARGYFLVPLPRVYAALSDWRSTRAHNQPPDGTTNLDIPPEQYFDPVSVSSVAYRVFYKTETHVMAVPVVKYDVISRLGWLEGSDADPIELGLRSHKTCGTTHIKTMDGSITVRAVPAALLPPGVTDATAFEMQFHLDADTQGQAECDGTLQTRFDDISSWLVNGPPPGLPPAQ